MKKKLVTVLLASSMVATMLIVVDIMSEINYITWI